MKKTKNKGLAVALAIVMLVSFIPLKAVFATASMQTRILELKTNGLTDPMGIDDTTPKFSWKMDSNVIGAAQIAYRIVVKDPSSNIVWDSNTVYSSESATVAYEGDALEASTAYTWTVAVTDQTGTVTTSEPAVFETALMNTSLDAWSGAQWIGADELTLDATAAALFDLRMSVEILPGSEKASVIFGANDHRLTNSLFNVWRTATEKSYFKYEIDISDPDHAKLNIYVTGMPVNGQSEENAPDEVDVSVDIPDTVINSSNAHEQMTVRITTADTNINRVSCYINGTCVDSGRQLNPLGNSHDYNSFPNLNSIGFAVPEGQTAHYRDVTVVNPGQYSEGVLFGENEGVTYDIFRDLSTDVTVTSAGYIEVKNGALVYADPSYGSAPMLRTEFSAGNKIESARMYITAQGIYEAYINGERVGDDWFNPGNSEYRERIAYHTYDVTGMLQNGGNAIGVQLSEGWWSGYQTYTASNYNYYGCKQALLVKLVINYTDGTSETIVSDPNTWDYYGDGPVEYGSFFQGERYNALKEADVEGWAQSGFNASGWRDASVITTKAAFSNYKLVTRYDEPAGVVNEIPALEALGESKPGSNSYIYDMGENVIGVPRITIPEGYADEGAEIIIRTAEILYPELDEYIEADLNGLLLVENLRAALCTDFYTAKAGAQVIEPSFTFHGYRYIEITGLKKELPADCIKNLVLSSIKMSATYDSSNELVNRLFKNVQNSQTSNFLSLPTDCPQRNERMGWTGDAQVFSMAATYNSDVYNFYRQWLVTLRDSQGANGSLPVTAPQYGTVTDGTDVLIGHPGSRFMGVSWDAALTVIPYNLYQQYGNKQIIEENIDAIYAYLNYLENNDMTLGTRTVPALTSKTGILADWLSRIPTNAALINNAVYIYLMDIAADMAEAVNRNDMAATLRTRYDAAKEAWNNLYVDPETGKTRYPVDNEGVITYTVQDTQASYATPLRYGVFSEENEQKAVEHYVETVSNPADYSDSNGAVLPYTITTGFSGTPNLVPVLTQYGYVDEAYALFEQTEYASWLYPVTQGATSVWERWNSYTLENGFGGNNSMNSLNHFSLGAISEWMMSSQLGIAADTNAPGYKRFILQPTVGGSFTYANGTFVSNYGDIYSGWTADNDGISSYKVTVPANSTATLYLPVDSADSLILPLAGVTYNGMTTNNEMPAAEFELLAGGYEFTIDESGITVEITDGYIINTGGTSSETDSSEGGGSSVSSGDNGTAGNVKTGDMIVIGVVFAALLISGAVVIIMRKRAK